MDCLIWEQPNMCWLYFLSLFILYISPLWTQSQSSLSHALSLKIGINPMQNSKHCHRISSGQKYFQNLSIWHMDLWFDQLVYRKIIFILNNTLCPRKNVLLKLIFSWIFMVMNWIKKYLLNSHLRKNENKVNFKFNRYVQKTTATNCL